MEERIIPMEDTAIPTEAPKDYLDMDMDMESARGLLMLSQVLVMEELTILMEDPAIPTEVSRDLPHTTPDMDMDMDSTSARLSLLTMEDMVMVETLMFLSLDLCTHMDMESTMLARGLLSLLITPLILMDPATSMCQDPILTMESMSTTARVSRLNQIKLCDQMLTH